MNCKGEHVSMLMLVFRSKHWRTCLLILGLHDISAVMEGLYHVDAATVLLSLLRIPRGGGRNYAL